MTCSDLRPTVALLVATVVLMPSPSRAADEAGSAREAAERRFLQELRGRGYFDLLQYDLEQIRNDSEAPEALRAVVDYELGRALLEEASVAEDLERRRAVLDEARARLDAFLKAHPEHPQAPDARTQLARLLVERGHLAVLQAEEAGQAKDEAARRARLNEARAAFAQARAAYESALKPLETAYESFDKYIPRDDPRYEARGEAHVALINALLQRALVDYEDAQTYPADAKPREKLLDTAIAEFQDIYQKHRTQLAGLYARMWQGKCYEEKGELGPAMGVYDELMGHNAAELRPLQRQVGFFRVIVLGKRGEYALAADTAAAWLQANPKSLRTPEGLGVQLELAKDLLAQLPKAGGKQAEAARGRAVDLLRQVVRIYSPYKAEAVELLKKYRPQAAEDARTLVRMGFDEAAAAADEAISAQEWDRALVALQVALGRADARKDPDKVNRVRYLLAFCLYQAKRYYEADVLAEFLARRYPRNGLAPKASEIGMAALTQAYNTFTRGDRTGDLDRLIDLARYTSETWPDADQGDAARVTLGEVAFGQGRYADAAEAFESVRSSSPRHLDALTRAAAAHWRSAPALDGPGRDAEIKAALGHLDAVLKGRQSAGAGPMDPGLLNAVCDRADILLATDRAKPALQSLEPRVKALPSPPPNPAPQAVTRLLATELRAYIASGQIEPALGLMNRLESAGGPAEGLTQLYFGLGRLLEKELEDLRAKGDPRLERMRSTYMKFLQALAASKAGQSYESLEWAGEALLSIGQPAEARDLFRQILDTIAKDEPFKQAPGAEARLLRTRIKLVAALRGAQQFDKAQQALDELIKEHSRLLDVKMEQGRLLEDRAKAEPRSAARWAAAQTHWQTLALQLRAMRPRPPEYYESWLHVAEILHAQKKDDEARQVLKAVLRLSPRLSGPEMKTRYDEMLRRLGS